MIPEHIATTYRSAIFGAAKDVHNSYGHIYRKRELISQAWAIAGGRWETWENPGHARTDLRLKLYHWVEGDLPALGYSRIRTSEGRRWVRIEIPESPFDVRGYLANKTQDAGDDEAEEIAYSLQADWEPMDRGTRIRFGRILLDDYPRLCAEFWRLEATGMRNKPRARAMLRVKWARELAEAKFIALYGPLANVA